MDNFGALGLIPPLLAIALAFFTKDAVLSLFVGVLSGTMIVNSGNLGSSLLDVSNLFAKILGDAWNVRIFLFCALLGGFVGLLGHTGAAHSFGVWAAKRLKSGQSSQFMTFIFGLIIFIDDYFSALATGSIMRPISDKTGTPRAKLAYNVHSTATAVCVIVPVSSWVVTIMSISKDAQGFESLGLSPLEFFLGLITYNLYAFGVLLFVLGMIVFKADFGPMKRAHERAKEGKLFDEEKFGLVPNDTEFIENNRANPFDMILPMILLICSVLVFFPLTTMIAAVDGSKITSLTQAYHSMSLSDAFKNTDASVALLHSIIFTFFFTFIYYIFRRLINAKTSMAAVSEGIKSMVPALTILILAWSIGTIIKSAPSEGGLGLGVYLSGLVVNGDFPVFLLASIVFLVSGLISFATGTSWGTFGIMIPLVMPIVTALGASNNMGLEELQNITFICIAAVVGGAIFGDNASPISDSTILSSTGAGCPVLEHIATQMPYAVTIAIAAAISFLFTGIFGSIAVGWVCNIALLLIALFVLPKVWR